MVWPIIAGMTLAVMLGRGSGIVNGWGGWRGGGERRRKFEIGETPDAKSKTPCANTAHGAPTNANAKANLRESLRRTRPGVVVLLECAFPSCWWQGWLGYAGEIAHVLDSVHIL